MEFIDLKTQQRLIRDKIDANIQKVLDHGSYINGPEVREIEEKLADYVGVKHAIGVSNGTDALLMPLMVYDIGPGDAVFTTAFSFFATAEVIALLKAEPVFVDIDEQTFNIDPVLLEKAIKRVLSEGRLKPRVIIPVDLFGQSADYDEIVAIAKKYDLFVMADSAQAFGGRYKNNINCSLGDVATTSFFPAKPLGCYGDGGMIFTNNDELNEKLLSIRVHGKGNDKYDNVRIGINGRLDTLQAAVLLAKFEIFDNELKQKQEVARRYNELLQKHVTVPFIRKDNYSAWAQYSVMSTHREKIMKKLAGEKIPVQIYYQKPLPYQQAFAGLKHKEGDFPVSEKISQKIFSLPMHAYLDEESQSKIAECIISA